MSHIYRLNIPRWVKNGEASYDIVIPAVERFGEAAVNCQAKWMEATIRKRFDEKHIFLLQEVPSEEAQKKLRIPNITITCASPLCPNFDNLIEAKSIVVAIEPEKNLAMSYVPLKPIAGLDEIHDSPIDGSKNWRGRGEHNVLWFHLTCLEALSTKQHDCPEPGPSEFPTMSQPLAAMSRCIQPESRPFVAGTKYTHLGSPRVQTLYKWQGVVQLEKALAFQDGNEGFYINDDMDAAYLVEKHSKLKGTVGRIPVEITGAQARGQLLSTLLRYIDGRKIEASKKKGESTSNHDYVKSAMTVDRRVENLGRLGGEIGTMKEFEEQDKGYEADVGEFRQTAAHGHSHLARQDLEQRRKRAMRWRLRGPVRNLWHDYLLIMRNAVLRATGLDADSAEASISEDSPTEITSSAAEESSTESLRLVTPMVRFLVSESEDNPSPSLDTPMQEVLSEADPTSSEEVESLDSWSDPDRTLATINKNVGLAVRLF